MVIQEQASSDDYAEFLKKFEVKKTTDDCYTPPRVYDAVKDWCVNEYGLDGRRIVRPFHPGSDYKSFAYQAGDVVIDNPPFSIIAKIVRFYKSLGVDFFLFAPALTTFNIDANTELKARRRNKRKIQKNQLMHTPKT